MVGETLPDWAGDVGLDRNIFRALREDQMTRKTSLSFAAVACLCVCMVPGLALAQICEVDLEFETADSREEYTVYVGEMLDEDGYSTGNLGACLDVAGSWELPELVGHIEEGGRGSCTTLARSASCGRVGCDEFAIAVAGANVRFRQVRDEMTCADFASLSLSSSFGEVVLGPFPEYASAFVDNIADNVSMGMMRGQTYCDLSGDGGTDYRYGEVYKDDDPDGFAVCRKGGSAPLCHTIDDDIKDTDDWIVIVFNDSGNDIRPGNMVTCNATYTIDSWAGRWAGHLSISGQDGDDTIHGSPNRDAIYGDDDNDTLRDGNGGDDSIYGGNGDDYLYGHNDNDMLHGGDDDDMLFDGDDCYGGGGPLVPSCLTSQDCCSSCVSIPSADCATP